jgi:histidyl-tRNA synthetase
VATKTPPKSPPQTLKGMRDILPSQMVLRQYVIGLLREVFERYGFEPAETPALEYADTLLGKYGEDADRLVYTFDDRGGRRVGLRYDLTVPLARVAAQYGDLPKPFKRYQIAPVWRTERPQKGRYREFYQCDVDTVGVTSMIADAEVIAVATEVLTRLGFGRFTVEINSRKLLVALGTYAGVPAELAGSLYRSIDKLDKIGAKAVRDELMVAGVASDAIGRLFELIGIRGKPEAVLTEVRRILGDDERALAGAREVEEIVGYLADLGVPESAYEVDLAMVRGLDYYTGPIFEVKVEEPKIGSLCGGGRYDGLIGTFTGQSLPAVGISVGLERIILVLEELGLAPASLGKTKTAILVSIFGPETRSESLRLVTELRRAGVNAEVALGAEKLANQLRYASRKGIPLVAILGSDEVAAGEVLVRDMVSGEQRRYPRAELGAALLAARAVD